MDPNEETVTISKKLYDSLKDDRHWRQCLENGGVDNWEWYGEAMAEYWGEEDDDEDDD